MAKNAIEVLDEGLKLMDEYNNKLLLTEKNILKITDAFIKADNKSFYKNKIPNDVNDTLKTNKTHVQQLNAELQERRRLEIALERQLAKNKLAESDNAKALAKARFETQELNKRAKEAAVLSSTLSTEYQKQSVKLVQLRRAYKDIALTQGEGSQAAKKLRTEITALDNRLKRVDANVGQFQRSVGNYGKAMQSAVASARNLAGALGFVGGAFLVARVFKDAFNRIREFDKEMQNMAGILRETRPQLKEIEREIIKVASSSIKTSNEVAKLATSLFTLGKTKSEVLDLLEPTNNLAIALGATSEEAGEFLIQTLNAFNKSSDSAAEFADTIAGIRANTTLDFQKMRDSFQYIAPISRLLGKDLAYTGAVVGVLADNSIKAEQAGRLLGTAQIKLATANKTLDEALQEINQAYRDGKTEIEILAIAGDLFGKQAAKIGAILATNTDALKDYEERINGAGGALDDLVNEQLKSVDAQLKITTSVWESFVLSIENGEGVISKALGSVLKFLNNAITGFTILNTSTEELQDRFENKITNKFYKEVTQAYKEAGDAAERLAIADLERTDDAIENIKKEITALEERNKTIEKSGKKQSAVAGLFKTSEYEKNKEAIEKLNIDLARNLGINKAAEKQLGINSDEIKENTEVVEDNSEAIIRNVKFIKEQIAEQQKLLDLATNREEAKAIQDKIAVLQKELEAILGSNKTKKEAKKIIEGSVKAYQELISELTDERDRLATNSKEYTDYTEKIEDAQLAIDKLTGALKILKYEGDGLAIDLTKLGLDRGGFENKQIQDKIDADAQKILIEKQTQEAIQALREGTLDHAKNLNDEQLKEIKEALDLQFELQKEFEQSKKDLVFEAAAGIFEAQIVKVDEQIANNQRYYDAILSNEELNEEQRSAIEAERDRKEHELQEKKKKREKTAFLVQQGLAVAEIALNLAKTITAINLTAAALDAVTFGVGGQIYRATNLPIAIGTAALQTGIVLAQAIPAFEKGKGEYDNYEGMAIWGEKKQEAKISKDGTIELSPKKPGNHLTHVKKDDIIHPDAQKFLSSYTDDEIYNNLHKVSILASMAHQSDTINSYLASLEQSNNKQSDKIVKALERKKMSFKVNQTINVGDDIAFALKKESRK